MQGRTYEKEEKQAYIEDYKNSGEPLSRFTEMHSKLIPVHQNNFTKL